MTRAKRPFGDAWTSVHSAEEVPEGWTMPGRRPLILRCTATVDSEAFVERIRPLVRGSKPPRLCDIDGMQYAVVPVKPRFLKALRTAQTPRDLGERLAQLLDGRLLRELWPHVWLEWHNFEARRAVRRECAMHRSLGPARSAYVSESVRHAAPRSIY